MPLYDLYCDCGYETEGLLEMYQGNPACPKCGSIMSRAVGSNIMVKMKGEGGYPSRRKQVFNTTSRNHPQLEPEKNRVFFGQIKF